MGFWDAVTGWFDSLPGNQKHTLVAPPPPKEVPITKTIERQTENGPKEETIQVGKEYKLDKNWTPQVITTGNDFVYGLGAAAQPLYDTATSFYGNAEKSVETDDAGNIINGEGGKPKVSNTMNSGINEWLDDAFSSIPGNEKRTYDPYTKKVVKAGDDQAAPYKNSADNAEDIYGDAQTATDRFNAFNSSLGNRYSDFYDFQTKMGTKEGKEDWKQWMRDNIDGYGELTYYDPKSKKWSQYDGDIMTDEGFDEYYNLRSSTTPADDFQNNRGFGTDLELINAIASDPDFQQYLAEAEFVGDPTTNKEGQQVAGVNFKDFLGDENGNNSKIGSKELTSAINQTILDGLLMDQYSNADDGRNLVDWAANRKLLADMVSNDPVMQMDMLENAASRQNGERYFNDPQFSRFGWMSDMQGEDGNQYFVPTEGFIDRMNWAMQNNADNAARKVDWDAVKSYAPVNGQYLQDAYNAQARGEGDQFYNAIMNPEVWRRFGEGDDASSRQESGRKYLQNVLGLKDLSGQRAVGSSDLFERSHKSKDKNGK